MKQTVAEVGFLCAKRLGMSHAQVEKNQWGGRMKRVLLFLLLLGIFVVNSGVAMAGGFYATTNELGYQGTIWNITESTGTWSTSAPRYANLYTVIDAPQIYSNYNQLMSSWFEHLPSNQNDSFLQLADEGQSIITATGGWDSALTTFTMSITGQNAPYPWSRFWQPDNAVAWGVTFTQYSYNFVATFSTAAILDANGFYVNSSSPNSIEGSFTGEFLVTADVNKNLIADGDTYSFDITFSKALFDPNNISNLYGYEGAGTAYSVFGSTQVPEPATMLFLGFGLIAAAGVRRRIKK